LLPGPVLGEPSASAAALQLQARDWQTLASDDAM
jgi:hypothetical protein